MDKTQLQQKIVEYFQKLPKGVQDVFASMAWVKVLEEIEIRYHLDGEQIETLGTETTLVLLGIIHSDEYLKVVSNLGLEKEASSQMLAEIEEKILKTIKDDLIQTFESNAFSLAEDSLNNPPVFDHRFDQIPEDTQNAIAKSNWRETLYETAKKYKLNIEQMGILEDATVGVISNTIHPDSYEKELSSKILIPKEDLLNLVNDVNDRLLKKIREIMKNREPVKTEAANENIPLPPYKKTINSDMGKTTESTLPKENTPEAKKEMPILDKSVEIPNEIEIPKPAQITPNIFNVPKNIVEEKLKGATSSKHSTSDYSGPSVGALSSKSHDPYREEV